MKYILTFILLTAAGLFPGAQAGIAPTGTNESFDTNMVLIVAIWVLIAICILVLIVTIYAVSSLKLVLKKETSPAEGNTVVIEEKNIQGWNILVPRREKPGISTNLKWALYIVGSIIAAGTISYFSLQTFNNSKLSGNVLLASNIKPDYSHDPAVIDSGKVVFARNCVPCHAPDGGGGIGPNLTDQYWIHGGNIKDIIATITNGVPAKGMITWSPILDSLHISDVAYYILSLQGTRPAKPKDPQGQLFIPGKSNSEHTALFTSKVE